MRHIAEYLRRIFVALRSRCYVLYFGRVYGVEFGANVRIYSRMIVQGPGKIVIGSDTHFTSRRATNELCTTHPDAVLQIGSGCLINGAIIGSAQSVLIGDRCIIAEAYIRDTSSHGLNPATRHQPGGAKIAPVVLGDNVWVGSHAHVMPGVTIGDNTVVGVNSVVTKSLPENVFAAGSPAAAIRNIDTDTDGDETTEPR